MGEPDSGAPKKRSASETAIKLADAYRQDAAVPQLAQRLNRSPIRRFAPFHLDFAGVKLSRAVTLSAFTSESS